MKWLALAMALVAIAGSAFFLSLNVWLWTSGAALIAAALAPRFVTRRSIAKPQRNTRQPNLYGDSEFAGIKAMAEGGITTERR
ncbi:MAG TPA: hypothetical protein VGM38_09515 [Pseudolysinimonas sp.]|jgi:hypothetical protein